MLELIVDNEPIQTRGNLPLGEIAMTRVNRLLSGAALLAVTSFAVAQQRSAPAAKAQASNSAIPTSGVGTGGLSSGLSGKTRPTGGFPGSASISQGATMRMSGSGRTSNAGAATSTATPVR